MVGKPVHVNSVLHCIYSPLKPQCNQATTKTSLKSVLFLGACQCLLYVSVSAEFVFLEDMTQCLSSQEKTFWPISWALEAEQYRVAICI